MNRNKNLSYDLNLSNGIFKSNSLSLIQISKETLENIAKQHEEFFDFSRTDRANWSTDEWLKKGSHVSNIEWLFLNSIFIAMFSSFEHH